jgi:hypothetical protein
MAHYKQLTAHPSPNRICSKCQTYLYFGKESVVARQLGLDIRTVSAIVEAEKRKAVSYTIVLNRRVDYKEKPLRAVSPQN